MKLKNMILLSGGVIASAIIPVAAVLSCGDTSTSDATQTEVDSEQTRINGLVTITTVRDTPIDAVTNETMITSDNSVDVLGTFGLADTALNFDKFTYYYTNSGLINDGTLTFTIIVKNKTATLVGANPTSNTVVITGITAGITLARVNAEQDRINKLATSSYTTSAAISASTETEITSANQTDVLKRFGLPSATNFDFTKFTYTYTNDALATDGALKFTIVVKDKITPTIVAKDPMPLEKTVNVTGISLALVNAEQDRINKLVTTAITSQTPVDATTDEISIDSTNKDAIIGKFGLPSTTNFDFTKFSYFYTNEALIANGNLTFKIMVKAESDNEVVATNPAASQNTVAVTGINPNWSKTQDTVNAEQSRINKLVTTPIKSATSIDANNSWRSFDGWDESLIREKFGLPNNTNFDFTKFSYTYANAALNASGNLSFKIKVSVRADKDGNIIAPSDPLVTDGKVIVATNPLPTENTVGVTFLSSLLGGSNIFASISDGNGGFFVGGGSGKFDHIGADGKLVANWTTETLLDGNDINAIASDGKNGFFVGGKGGKLDHIGADGKPVDTNWTTETLLGGKDIQDIASDGQNGFFVGGWEGKLDHIGADGKLVANWTTETLLSNGETIYTLVPDGNGGFFVGGGNGKLDHINKDGQRISAIKIVLAIDPSNIIYGGYNVLTIVSDGKDGFFVGGAHGKLDHIDKDGQLVANWTTETLLGGNDINAIVSDGQNGFFVGGQGGKLDHIGADGKPVASWTTKTLLGGNDINAILQSKSSLLVTGNNGIFDFFTL